MMVKTLLHFLSFFFTTFGLNSDINHLSFLKGNIKAVIYWLASSDYCILLMRGNFRHLFQYINLYLHTDVNVLAANVAMEPIYDS